MTARITTLAALCLIAAGLCFAADPPPSPTVAPAVAAPDFVRDIQPILARNCYECHGAKKKESGLRWDKKRYAFAGGDSAQHTIVPGKPAESRLIKVVSGTDEGGLKMPAKKPPLSASQIDLLTRWVAAGATWPDGVDPADGVPPHWSFVKPTRPAPPKIKQSDWPRNGLDHFILAQLEKAGLKPSPEADRYTQIRRLYLDVLGLPPTPAEADAFAADKSPNAYEKLVDHVLRQPAYGERWARVWLDLARYADSSGYGSDPLRMNIWPYRDWVINAFNSNMPFDRFTTEQIAGDLLPNPTTDQILATAFHRNTMTNTEGGTDDEEFRVAAVKDRIATTLEVWMGLTMGCAQCHTHKYDPITQREYYQFFAIFNQSADSDRGDEEPKMAVPTPGQREAAKRFDAQIAELKKQLEAATPELAAAQAAWEKSLTAQVDPWTVLDPQQATATSGATLAKMPDKSLLASGPIAGADVYTITAPADLPNITAVRLEALPDDLLGGKGPGRSGNFVLNDFRVIATPLAAKPTLGRFVRVELPGQARYLHLAEVQVFSGGQNIAPQGKASESSVDYMGEAKFGIDGITDGNYAAHTTTHTKQEDNPWWEVDLGRMIDIGTVVVWNRTDQNTVGRLDGFRVVILDANRQPTFQSAATKGPAVSAEFSTGGATQLALKNASADFSQQNFGVEKAIDAAVDANSGWAVSPETGKAHAAVFELAGKLPEGGATLTFTLVQNYDKLALGRFRLSVTNVPTPIANPPANIVALVALPAANRTAAQQAELAAYYRTVAPSLSPIREKLTTTLAEQAKLSTATIATPIMKELAGNERRKTWMLVKGNYLNHGGEVEPAVLDAFHPLPKDASPNRLGVAMWLTDKENPLTARVTVNRFWANLMGRGIVETEEDFGTQGAAPTNQPLLDWLAVEFVENHWDVKGIIKTIVTSATYRQSARVTPEVLAKDAGNHLFAHAPRFRLEAETVRDQALALSGLLSTKMYGPSVYPPQPDGLWRAAFNGERTYPTSQGEDKFRRGLYVFWRRTVPYPSMSTFDAPSREICSLRRIRTNTPLQAFVTLNDPVYVEAAQALARRIVKEGGATPEQRIAFGLKLCLLRPPQEAQVKALLDLYAGELEKYKTDTTAALQMATDPLGPLPAGMDAAELAAWSVVANVLLNLDGVLTRG
jgi:hypothetical protein